MVRVRTRNAAAETQEEAMPIGRTSVAFSCMLIAEFRVCVCVVGDCSFWVVFDTSNNECFMVSGLIIKMQFDMMTMTYKIKIVDDPLEMR